MPRCAKSPRWTLRLWIRLTCAWATNHPPGDHPAVAAAVAAALAQKSFAQAQAAIEATLDEELAAFSTMQVEADFEKVDPVKKQEKLWLCRQKNLAIRKLV